jgi:hypothetical protein
MEPAAVARGVDAVRVRMCGTSAVGEGCVLEIPLDVVRGLHRALPLPHGNIFDPDGVAPYFKGRQPAAGRQGDLFLVGVGGVDMRKTRPVLQRKRHPVRVVAGHADIEDVAALAQHKLARAGLAGRGERRGAHKNVGVLGVRFSVKREM